MRIKHEVFQKRPTSHAAKIRRPKKFDKFPNRFGSTSTRKASPHTKSQIQKIKISPQLWPSIKSHPRAHVPTGDPFLLAVHHVDVVLHHRRGADVGHVRARGGLADGQADVFASGKPSSTATVQMVSVTMKDLWASFVCNFCLQFRLQFRLISSFEKPLLFTWLTVFVCNKNNRIFIHVMAINWW